MIEIANIEPINQKIIIIEKKYSIQNIDTNINTITVMLDNQTTAIDNTISNSISLSNYANIVNIRK